MITVDKNQQLDIHKKMFGWVKQRMESNYYQDHYYYVLPTLPKKFRSRVIVFPRSGDIDMNAFCYRSGSVSKFVKRITKDIEEIEHALEPLHITKSIRIIPTTIGGQGSFHLKEHEYCLYIRTDRSSYGVLLLILSAFFTDSQISKENRDSKTHWQVTQATLPDFIQSLNLNFKGKSVLHRKPQKYLLTMHQSGNYAAKSAQYLNELGFPLKQRLGISPTIETLSEQEKKVLNRLLHERHTVVSFAAIASELKGEFSLYAISKVIARIRKKIQNYLGDAEYNPIHCERGKGYILYD